MHVRGPEAFEGWERTWRLENDAVAVRILADVGPRIVELRSRDGANLLHLRPSETGGRGEGRWRMRGGWRLWVAPERRRTTYALDNDACEVTSVDGRTLRVVAPPQPAASIQKTVTVGVDGERPCVAIESRVVNVGDAPVTYAPWTLAVLRPGGRAFVPLGRGPREAFDAVRRIILWSYARLDDPRYRVGDGLIAIDSGVVVRRPPRVAIAPERWDDESKIGVDATEGWAAYLLDGTLFVSRAVVEAGPRADGGATVEVFTCREFIELEHLGILRTLAPGEAAMLRETWWVFDGVTLSEAAEGPDAAARVLARYVDRTADPT